MSDVEEKMSLEDALPVVSVIVGSGIDNLSQVSRDKDLTQFMRRAWEIVREAAEERGGEKA
jgi:hypothetical protein